MNGQMLTMHYTGTLEDGSKLIHQLIVMNHSNSKLVSDKLSKDGKKVSWACALAKKGDLLFLQNLDMETRVLVRLFPVVLPYISILNSLGLKKVHNLSMCSSK